MSDDEIDWDHLKSQRSSTDSSERKHCAQCGSISLSPRGSSIHARIEDKPYRCEGCGDLVDACRDTPGDCEH